MNVTKINDRKMIKGKMVEYSYSIGAKKKDG